MVGNQNQYTKGNQMQVGQQVGQQSPRWTGTVIDDGNGLTAIPEATPSWELMQGLLPYLQANHAEIKATKHSPAPPPQKFGIETVEYTPSPADWDQIGDWIQSDMYTPENRDDWEVKNKAWHFAANLFLSLKLCAKDAYRSLVQWSGWHKAGLTQNKILQTLSNARAMLCGYSNPPASLWKTDRWDREKCRREHLKEQLTSATGKLQAHATNNGWNAQTEADRLALRQLHNWNEGRARCGNSYWWVRYESPGLEHLREFGVTSFCKTGHVCSSPGCPDCALWETEKETADWEWERAYGIGLPVVVQFDIGPDVDAKTLKTVVARMVKRRRIQSHWYGCFGCYVPTSNGYSLQLMMQPSIVNKPGVVAEMSELWNECCLNQLSKFGRVSISEPNLPAIDCAIELILKAERELFRLIDDGFISIATGWKWFCNWIGSKPGAKGMNRIFHAPGWRDFKAGLAEDEELNPNMLDPMLDDNSSESEEGVNQTVPDHDFPRTWFSLESQYHKGWLLKVEDPYLNQTIYLNLGGYNQADIPKEYLDTKTGKAVCYASSAQHSNHSSKSEAGQDRGLSPRAQGQIPQPAYQRREIKAVVPQPLNPNFNPWQTYSPEARARAKGTFRGAKPETTLADNQYMQPETLTREVGLSVHKKIDPDRESNLLALELF